MTRVIIDVFVYSCSFLLCYLDTKHARILSFTNHYYIFDLSPCLVEAHCKLSMLFRYTLYHPPPKFCEYACHCELCLCLIVLGCLNIWLIVRLFLIKRMLGDILFELTLMFLWQRLSCSSGTHPLTLFYDHDLTF